VNYVGTAIDIGRMKHAQSELERLAHHDGLTNLPNRQLFVSRLGHAMELARRRAGLGAVLFIDLDHFKQVNDTLGHKAGDDLLQAVASRIKGRLRESDTFARLGGDEFVILLEDIASPDAAATLAQDVIRQTAIPFALPCGAHAHIGASVGIALFPQDGSGAANLIERADQALYEAKRGGRGDYRFCGCTERNPGGRMPREADRPSQDTSKDGRRETPGNARQPVT
jgi:diguanylate cyclase (GGDEF)-like protein